MCHDWEFQNGPVLARIMNQPLAQPGEPAHLIVVLILYILYQACTTAVYIVPKPVGLHNTNTSHAWRQQYHTPQSTLLLMHRQDTPLQAGYARLPANNQVIALNTHTHTHARTCIHTRMHTHACTHTHTHTLTAAAASASDISSMNLVFSEGALGSSSADPIISNITF